MTDAAPGDDAGASACRCWHGVLESDGRIAAVYVFRELGMLPQVRAPGAGGPVARRHGSSRSRALSPGLSNLPALRSRLGYETAPTDGQAHRSRFSASGGGLRLVSVTHPAYADKLRFFAENTGRRC